MQSEGQSAKGLKFAFLCSPIAHLDCNISSTITNKDVKMPNF